MPAARTPNINLIEEDKLLTRPGGRFVSWSLSYGRVILVLTELVVICALIARFWLYDTIADLSERVDAKVDIINDSSEFEEQFRSLTERIATISSIISATTPKNVFDATRALIPEGIAVDNLTVTQVDVSFTGSAVSEKPLATLTNNFKNSSLFTDVSVDKFNKRTSKDEQSLEFSFKALYKKP